MVESGRRGTVSEGEGGGVEDESELGGGAEWGGLIQMNLVDEV